MKDNIKELLQALPDFTDLMEISNKIADAQYLKLNLDIKIKIGESNVFKEAFTNPEYLQNGKPPSATSIESALKYPGLKGELIPLREEYATVSAQLEKLRMQMDIYKQMVEIWRTLCSNERTATLS